VYEETGHSRGFAEREGQQEAKGDEDWGRESGSEEEAMGEEERKRVFRQGLERMIGGR
jgi:hypothetical protein